MSRTKTHGLSLHPLYAVWNSMRNRCNNPKNPGYSRYGGRGITVCAEWDASLTAFMEWAYANGYQEGLTIDRTDNDGNYCPQNCRWVTYLVNLRNRAATRKPSVRKQKVPEVFLPSLLSIPKAAKLVGIGHEAARRRVVSGEWKSILIGKRLRVPRAFLLQKYGAQPADDTVIGSPLPELESEQPEVA